jgi:hypothetical protein
MSESKIAAKAAEFVSALSNEEKSRIRAIAACIQTNAVVPPPELEDFLDLAAYDLLSHEANECYQRMQNFEGSIVSGQICPHPKFTEAYNQGCEKEAARDALYNSAQEALSKASDAHHARSDFVHAETARTIGKLWGLTAKVADRVLCNIGY